MGPCPKSEALLYHVSLASEAYFNAASRMVELAETSVPERFREAHRDATACSQACTRAKADLKAHKAIHGC